MFCVIFLQLQCSCCTASTETLMTSLGWASYEAFMRHEALEVTRKLVDKLEQEVQVFRVLKGNHNRKNVYYKFCWPITIFFVPITTLDLFKVLKHAL